MGVTAGIFLASILQKEMRYLMYIRYLLLLLLQLYFNTELIHNIKLTKYIQRENKMSDLPIGRIYKNYYYFRCELKLIFETLDGLRSFKITR